MTTHSSLPPNGPADDSRFPAAAGKEMGMVWGAWGLFCILVTLSGFLAPETLRGHEIWKKYSDAIALALFFAVLARIACLMPEQTGEPGQAARKTAGRNGPGPGALPALGLCVMTAASGTVLVYFPLETPSMAFAVNALHSGHLLIAGLWTARWMTRILEHPRDLIPLGTVMAAADLFSVFAGPGKDLAGTISRWYAGGKQGPVPAVEILLVKMPVPGAWDLMPVFGVSDWIIMVFLTAAARRFHLNDRIRLPVRRTAGVPAAVAGCLLAVTAAWVRNIVLPALPCILICWSMVTGLRHPGIFRPTRREWRLCLYGALSVLAVLLLYRLFPS